MEMALWNFVSWWYEDDLIKVNRKVKIMFRWQKKFGLEFLINHYIVWKENKTSRGCASTKGLAIYCVGDFDFLIPKRE